MAGSPSKQNDELTEHYGIGVIEGKAPHTSINIIEEFDHETFERYSLAVSNSATPLNRFTIQLVEHNFQSYVNLQKFATRLISLGRQFGSSTDHIQLGQSVMTQIVNWLTAFRLYLDHAETNLKRRYGDTSPQVQRFKERTASAFDNTSGYRFIYRFRNYVQHCGVPISSMTVNEALDDEGQPQVDAHGKPVARVKFLLNSEDLLDNFEDGWGPKVLNDLRAMGEPFELMPLAVQAMGELRQVERLLLEIAVEAAAETVADIKEALDRLPGSQEGVPTLFRFTVDSQPMIRSVSPRPLPSTESIGLLAEVAAGTKEASELVSDPAVQEPPPFDADTIAARIRSDSRAVQLMTLWQAEGGQTPTLVQQVNAIIAEDQSLEPILNGFFYMTAVLTHMISAVLGIDPQGFIGGLLDVYATPPKGD